MSEDNKIEEMADILVNGCKMGGCEECKYSEDQFPQCTLKYTADQIYNAGFRKTSDVAREIFDEIEEITMHGITSFGLQTMTMGEVAFAELKKKYTEGVE